MPHPGDRKAGVSAGHCDAAPGFNVLFNVSDMYDAVDPHDEDVSSMRAANGVRDAATGPKTTVPSSALVGIDQPGLRAYTGLKQEEAEI
jgi:hypothetical protein